MSTLADIQATSPPHSSLLSQPKRLTTTRWAKLGFYAHRARHVFEPDGQSMAVDTWIEPGCLPAHSHPNQEERWSVIEGAIRFQLGGRKHVIDPQDGLTSVTRMGNRLAEHVNR